MTRRLNRRTLIGGSMEIIGAAGFGSLAFAAEEEAAPSPPPRSWRVAWLNSPITLRSPGCMMAPSILFAL